MIIKKYSGIINVTSKVILVFIIVTLIIDFFFIKYIKLEKNLYFGIYEIVLFIIFVFFELLKYINKRKL